MCSHNAASHNAAQKLSPQQKLELIKALGLETLTQVLEKCYLMNNKKYNARDEARFTWNMLNGKKNFWEESHEK